MPNKEAIRSQTSETKLVASPVQQVSNPKAAGVTPKVTVAKVVVKEAMSPTTPAQNSEPERTELLGSLTTQQQQRTSARVIKKLRLEPLVDKDKRAKRTDGTDDIPECETPIKIDEKEPLKFPTVKQRMPKALWSTDEKNLFFEALNEYGKDFDAITSYICAKMKKKGMADANNLKTKTQVSHFYYRTWHKLSKHVQFDENVKKVAQELYALINYGELRKKLVSVNEKTCARLGEMVLGGSMVVRARGRNLRVRTPMCRALRKLNQITERACGLRVCSRAQVVLRARQSAAWARVQAAAHNPRAAVTAPLRTSLAALIRALHQRWSATRKYRAEKLVEPTTEEGKEMEYILPELSTRPACLVEDEELDNHLGLETDRMIVEEQKLPKKPVLHVGPRLNADIHIPSISPSEQLSSQKICFSSYLERMCLQRRDKSSGAKIRTPKRQRKDSISETKEAEPKKFKLDDDPVKLINIDETAIDGIELMAHYKHNQDDEEKPSTEDEKDLKSEETAEEEGEMEREKETETDKEISERDKDMLDRDKELSEKEKDSLSEMEDDDKYNKSESDNESDHGKEKRKERKFKNLKVKFRIRPKKRGGMYAVVIDKDQEEGLCKEEPSKEEEAKPEIDVDLAVRQVRKGWSMYDAGDLTVGDLYLMFGSRSKLELDYWWAEPTPPLPRNNNTISDSLAPTCDKDKKEKADKTPDKDSAIEDSERARESDTDIFSPKNPYSQDSNDGLSGDERKSEQTASPDHKSSSASSTFKLVSKLINRPAPAQTSNTNNGFSQLSDRLKRLLALVGNTHVAAGSASIARCTCGHVCPQQKRQVQKQMCMPQCTSQMPPKAEDNSTVFRHPTPIAPRPENDAQKTMNILEGLPRWRRGRPRTTTDRRVVVQRLLPLLPKLPPPSNLIPVKIVPNSPPPLPRILPKPPVTSTSDLSFFYVLSESNGQFFFHDGDRRIPITPLPTNKNGEQASEEEGTIKKEDVKAEDTKSDASSETAFLKDPVKDADDAAGVQKTENDNPDIANFLPSESMSLSPSRLLRDADGWLEGSVQDFSLSSFLGHLEGRVQPDLAVESQLQSLMAESSVDYVAKFADLAAEVTDDHPLPRD